jgi:WD40 repeat protein
MDLTGHSRRPLTLSWHPTTANILASTALDMTVRVWDVEKGQEKLNVKGTILVVLVCVYMLTKKWVSCFVVTVWITTASLSFLSFCLR